MLHERPCIQSQAAAAVVTMDTDMYTSLTDNGPKKKKILVQNYGGQTESNMVFLKVAYFVVQQ